MKQQEPTHVTQQLQDVPAGGLTIVRNSPSGQEYVLLTGQFSAKTVGKGKIEAYHVFPGVDASYNLLSAAEITVHHAASSSVLELFYCRNGRVGWNMRGGTAVYLGAGDLTAHSSACCADSAMMFPLGYGEGLSISVDLRRLAADRPGILQAAAFDPKTLQSAFCSGKPAALPSSPELEGIFQPLYTAKPSLRLPYLQLKVQELLLYLSQYQTGGKELTQYFSRQTEQIKDIHKLLTEHLDQRFTIEDLSRRYLMNTSTLKAVFKTVYGLPIATYMKEYRIHRAMELLRERDDSIASIAEQVGYGSQGKFTKAFKDVTQLLPTEYRKNHLANKRNRDSARSLADKTS